MRPVIYPELKFMIAHAPRHHERAALDLVQPACQFGEESLPGRENAAPEHAELPAMRMSRQRGVKSMPEISRCQGRAVYQKQLNRVRPSTRHDWPAVFNICGTRYSAMCVTRVFVLYADNSERCASACERH